MGTKNRPTAASVGTTSALLVAAAAVAATLAVIFLLRPAETHAARATGATVSTAKTGLGRILVNSSGRTLYLFEKDRKGMSACTGQCASFWPPLMTKGKPRAIGGAKASLLGTTKRANGRLQVTYNHHPVYTFAEDTKKGQTKGEGIERVRRDVVRAFHRGRQGCEGVTTRLVGRWLRSVGNRGTPAPLGRGAGGRPLGLCSSPPSGQ
jgi:predicted lipoprotein with Yx(FWY)xxD motif